MTGQSKPEAPRSTVQQCDVRRAATLAPVAWKNGGGTTSEIAVWPRAASFDAFVWRVSVAEIAQDGAFSDFPGVDRTIVLLSGAGMDLEGGPAALAR
ncbi:MAG: HutD/Ves family protein, partial [Janthinobacterium lividum]